MRDYYEILGVSRDADTDAIKKAYRQLALQYHPDRNNGSRDAEEKFKEATQAYEVLRDSEKRAAYDRYGQAGVRSGAGPGFGGFDFSDALEIFMRDFGGFGVEDLFGMRGGGRRGRVVRKGQDVRVRLPLTLAEVATGTRKTLKLELLATCTGCGGTGAERGASPVQCGTCGGTGEVRRVQRSFLGQLVTVIPCPDCGGEGVRVHKPCPDCRGQGVQPAEKRVEVQVPAGVSTGDYITLRGQGNAGVRGGPVGDILAVLEVAEDPRFVRDGADLIMELPVTFSEAALGTEADVPLLPEGTARVKVAPGTQAGRMIRLRGKGLPRLQSPGRGDLIVRLMVWTPTELSSEQEALLRQLAQVEDRPPERISSEDERGFWSKLREAFTGS